MNLIEESFQNREEKKQKRASKIILGAIIFLFIAIFDEHVETEIAF